MRRRSRTDTRRGRGARGAAVPAAAVAAVLTLLVATVAGTASAQEQQAAPDIPDDELRTYAAMYLDIADIQNRMQTDLQEASSDAEREKIRDEANAEIVRIIEANEAITLERYKEITNIINNDPEQRKEFRQLLQKLAKEKAEEEEKEPPLR